MAEETKRKFIKGRFYLQTSKCNEIHESEISEMMHVAF
jgi:hypothetical protein